MCAELRVPELACSALRVARCAAYLDPAATALLLRSCAGVRDGSCRVRRPPKNRCMNCLQARPPRIDTPYCRGCRLSLDPEICKTAARSFGVPESALAALSPRRRRGGYKNYPVAWLTAYCRDHAAECLEEIGRRRSVHKRALGENFVRLSLGPRPLLAAKYLLAPFLR
jgi:hypothetical protein